MAESMRDNPKVIALGYFKDWSNYLLVTSVGAVGWIAHQGGPTDSIWALLSLWSLALAVVFGIFTLALIPLVAEQIRDTDASFHSVEVTYQLFGSQQRAYIWQACRPQHVFFILGVLFYVMASANCRWLAFAVGILGVATGRFLWLHPDFVGERRG